MITTLSVPSSRVTNLPGSSTAEMWAAQIQPRKSWSSSQSSTSWSTKAAGGSIDARSTGRCVSATSRGSRGRDVEELVLIDLVVNRMLV